MKKVFKIFYIATIIITLNAPLCLANVTATDGEGTSSVAVDTETSATTTGTTSTTTTSTSSDGEESAFDPAICAQQKAIRAKTLDRTKSGNDTGVSPMEGSISDFSCLGDIWADIKDYFGGGGISLGGISLGGIWDMATDMACGAVQGAADALAGAVTGAIDGAVDGALDAAGDLATGVFDDYTKGIASDLKAIEDLTSQEGKIDFASEFVEPQIEAATDQYSSTLYRRRKDLQKSVKNDISEAIQ